MRRVRGLQEVHGLEDPLQVLFVCTRHLISSLGLDPGLSSVLTFCLRYVSPHGPIPRRMNATTQQRMESAASTADKNMEGNQSARVVSYPEDKMEVIERKTRRRVHLRRSKNNERVRARGLEGSNGLHYA